MQRGKVEGEGRGRMSGGRLREKALGGCRYEREREKVQVEGSK